MITIVNRYSSFSLNGRATGASALVKNKIAHALAASSEYNANNAWNVNFSSGNVNNNNKYNNNYVRAVAALSEEEIESWIVAFEDCCKKKKSGSHCTYYRSIYEEDLIHLAVEVKLGIYEPGVSICFIVTRPKLREVFAACFRDRIVQHWICLRLNPLFEAKFEAQGNVSFNCRTGYGTLAAVQSLAFKMYNVTKGYTVQAYVGKFDLRSFFMSIDKYIMLELITELINTQYTGADKDELLYLSKIVILHEPQKNCIRKGSLKLWDFLAKNKSLFYALPGVGMPIGNLTSQLFANYYMSFFDEWVLNYISKYGGEYIRFVDDFVIVIPSSDKLSGKDIITQFHKEAILWLGEHLHLSLHSDKVYVQDAKKGVKFVGSVIKPNRVYTSNRTVASLTYKLSQFENYCFDLLCNGGNISVQHTKLLEHDIDSINSYLGSLVHTNSYAIRANLFLGTSRPFFWKFCYVQGHLQTVKLKKKYKLGNKLLTKNEDLELQR